MLTRLHLKTAATVALALGAVTAGPAAAKVDLNQAPTFQPASPQVAASSNSARLGSTLAWRYEARFGAQRSPVVTVTSRGFTGTGRTTFAIPRSSVVTATSHGSTTGPRLVGGLSAGSRFDWGDAGVGAAGGLTLSLIALGGALLVIEHRRNGLPGVPVEPAVGL